MNDVVTQLAFYYEVWSHRALINIIMVLILFFDEEPALYFLELLVKSLVLSTIVKELASRHFINVDVGVLLRILVNLCFATLCIYFIFDHHVLVVQEIDFLTQLIITQRIIVCCVFQENYLDIVQVLLWIYFDEVILHNSIIMHWELIVVHWELLERCTVGMAKQLKPVFLFVLFVVICVLILRQKEVVVVGSGIQL